MQVRRNKTMTIVINNRSRGRPRAFDRDQALQRAMETFWANGYDATSIPMLTEAMGISAQSLYAAFGSKDALYREAIALYQSTVGGFGTRAMAEEEDALAAMARLFRDAASAFTSSPTHPGCMITTAPAGRDDDLLTIFGRQLRAEAMRQVKTRLERGVRDGDLRADTDCEAWARYVAGIVQGLSTQARDGETLEGLLTITEIAARSLEELRR
jgi:AcrR family transcriptional regulator